MNSENVNARTGFNVTPLVWRHCRKWDFALLLITHGADVSDPRLLFRVLANPT